jgi:hypothetical protein
MAHPCVYPERFVEFSLDLTQGAVTATYTACTASGDIMILGCNYYEVVAGGGDLVSLDIATDAGTPLILMSAAEGAVANLLIGSHPTSAMQAWVAPWTLRSTQHILYTLTVGGAAHLGSGKLIVRWAPLSAGAVLA